MPKSKNKKCKGSKCFINFLLIIFIEARSIEAQMKHSFVGIEGYNYSAMCNPNMLNTEENSGTEFSWKVPYHIPRNTSVLENYNNRELVLLKPSVKNSGVYSCTASKDGLSTMYRQRIVFGKLSQKLFQEINITILSTNACFGKGRAKMKIYSSEIKKLFCDPATTTPESCHFTFSDMTCSLESGSRARDFYGAARLQIIIFPRITPESYKFLRCRDWHCMSDRLYNVMNNYYLKILEKLATYNTDIAEYPYLYRAIRGQLPDALSFTKHAQHQSCGLGYEKGDRDFLCVPCPLGYYGSSGFICLKCPDEQYQDEYASRQCKTCKDGKVTAKQNGCEKTKTVIKANPSNRKLLKRSSITYIYPKSHDNMKWVLVGVIVACCVLIMLPVFICCDLKHKREMQKNSGVIYNYSIGRDTIMTPERSHPD